MTRALLCLAIIALQLTARQEACCRPPDKVAYSPIPPLKPAPRRSVTRVDRSGPVPTGAGRAHESTWLPFPPSASSVSSRTNLHPQTTPTQQSDSVSASGGDDSAADKGSEQAEIWNSSEMLLARNAVLEFCHRSAQTSPAEGQHFLERLSQLAPEEMRDWLERFQTRRRYVSSGQEVESMGRQLTIEYTLRQQEAMRRAAENIAELRRQAAERANEQSPPVLPYETARFLTYECAGSKRATLSYDPFDAVTDPMSPRGYARRVAAAMSLPGDLPRDDPRNFMRGDEGADFGEWATTRDAEPPIPPFASLTKSAAEQ